MLNFKKIQSKIIVCIFICIALFFTSCVRFIDVESALLINIFYKDHMANYCISSVFYNNKTYFQKFNKIFSINSFDDCINNIGVIDNNLHIFSIDNEKMYFTNNQKNLKLYSSDLNCDDIKEILEDNYGGSVAFKPPLFCVSRGTIYNITGEIFVFKNNTFNILKLGENKIFAPEDVFTISKNEDYIFINEKMHNVSGMYDIRNNVFMSYYKYADYPVILTSDKKLNKIFIMSGENLYVAIDKIISKITKLPNCDLLSFFAEDDNNLYIAARSLDKKEVLLQVNKTSGNIKLIYTTESPEIVALTPQYYIIYKNGDLFKYGISDNKLISKVKIFNASEINNTNINFEYCNKYLFIDNTGFGQYIFDLVTMKEVR